MDLLLGALAILGFMICSLLGTLMLYIVFIAKDEKGEDEVTKPKNKLLLLIVMIALYITAGWLANYAGVFNRGVDDAFIGRP